MGQVDLRSGKVYRHHLGPDEYVGRVSQSGELYLHVPLSPDEYLGKVTGMQFISEGGAALLLFFMNREDNTE